MNLPIDKLDDTLKTDPIALAISEAALRLQIEIDANREIVAAADAVIADDARRNESLRHHINLLVTHICTHYTSVGELAVRQALRKCIDSGSPMP